MRKEMFVICIDRPRVLHGGVSSFVGARYYLGDPSLPNYDGKILKPLGNPQRRHSLYTSRAKQAIVIINIHIKIKQLHLKHSRKLNK